jgi:hypothetical protein
MRSVLASSESVVLAVVFSIAAGAQVLPQQQTAIDRIIGSKGTYVADDRVYKVILPREEAATVQDYQKLSPNLRLNSWGAFSAAIHREAVFAGQLLLLDDEVDSVLSAALDAGLEVTGLSSSLLLDGPLYTPLT